MLISLKYALTKAQKHHYAVPAFNINNLEFLQAIIKAAELEKSPVIVQTSEGAISYAGMENLVILVKHAAKKTKVPVVLHLDHGRDKKILKNAIKNNYSSVMIDASHEAFEKNIAITKEIVKSARKKGISVEAELGTIGGAEDNIKSRKILFTDPSAAKEFVKKTGIDALAVAIGTSHGVNKFEGKSNLNLKLLKKIKEQVKIPLVLHGASTIPKDIVDIANKYGAHLKHTVGVSPAQLKKAVKLGICKVNIDSDLRLAFDAAIRKQLQQHPDVFDPRKILSPAAELITDLARKKMKLLGSSGKA